MCPKKFAQQSALFKTSYCQNADYSLNIYITGDFQIVRVNRMALITKWRLNRKSEEEELLTMQ